MKKRFAKISLMLAFILILTAFAGCSSANNAYSTAPQAAASAMDMAPRVPMPPSANVAGGFALSNKESAVLREAPAAEEIEMDDMALGDEYDGGGAPTGGGVAGPVVTPVVDARKIIKNVDLRLQTLTFDTGVESIPKIAESFDGYVQDSYVEGRDMYNERGTRNANFTIRIPVERLDSFLDSVGGEFHVISKSQNSQDITESYYDSKARLDALKIQEERLLEMLKQAAELEYLLQVEKELMNVRYEIESLTSSLNRMDSYVSMSTVTVYLSEVVKYEPVEDVPVTFGERILRAFHESWKSFSEFAQNFAVWFVAEFPFLLLLTIIAIICIAIIRKNIKRDRAKKSKNYYVPPIPAPTVPVKEISTEEPPTQEEKK